jgi:hypothetical protein
VDQGSSESSLFGLVGGLGKIFTMDNLRKRNLVMVDWCCMCKRDGKSLDDLLLYCEVAYAL